MEKNISVNKLITTWEISDEDYQLTLTRFTKDGIITNFPKKFKGKVCLFIFLSQFFVEDKQYSESEVNFIISQHYSDYVTARRSLVDYGLLSRTSDGKVYERNK